MKFKLALFSLLLMHTGSLCADEYYCKKIGIQKVAALAVSNEGSLGKGQDNEQRLEDTKQELEYCLRYYANCTLVLYSNHRMWISRNNFVSVMMDFPETAHTVAFSVMQFHDDLVGDIGVGEDVCMVAYPLLNEKREWRIHQWNMVNDETRYRTYLTSNLQDKKSVDETLTNLMRRAYHMDEPLKMNKP